MGAPDRLEQAQAAIAGLFGGKVAVATADPRQPQPAPLGEEAAHLSRAVAKRRGEFAAGRACARAAMEQLGLAPQPILAGDDRLPCWPGGLRGSISHSDSLCAAVLTREPVLLGLDLEPDTPLNPRLLDTICSADEQARIAGPDTLRMAKLIFSAKEAAYKAQYPASRMVFGFDHLDVMLDPAQGRFTATFLKDARCFTAGQSLRGRFDLAAGHFLTAVTLPRL